MTWRAAVLAVLVLAPTSVRAELVRVPMDAVARIHVPRAFNEVIERIERTSYDVSWVDQPYYDPYYSSHGGATYGYVSLISPTTGQNVDVTWIEFDTAAGTAEQLQQMHNTYGADSYVRFEGDGVYYLQVYAYSYDEAEAEDLFTQIAGARR